MNLPPFPALEPSGEPERIKRGLFALRSEFDAEDDAARRAALSFEQARTYDALDDLASAARDALAATNLAPGFVEPLERLISISLRRRSRGNLKKLLERLLKISPSKDAKLRAALELSEHHVLAGDETEAAALILSLLDEYPEEPSLWLFRDLLAAKTGSLPERLRATTGRVSTAGNSEFRAELLDRAARLALESGNEEESVALALQALDEMPSLRRAERLLYRLASGTNVRGMREISSRIVDALRVYEADADAELAREIPEAERDPSALSFALVRDLLFLLRDGGAVDGDEARRSLVELMERCPAEILIHALRLITAETTKNSDEHLRCLQAALEQADLRGEDPAVVWTQIALLTESPEERNEAIARAQSLAPGLFVATAKGLLSATLAAPDELSRLLVTVATGEPEAIRGPFLLGSLLVEGRGPRDSSTPVRDLGREGERLRRVLDTLRREPGSEAKSFNELRATSPALLWEGIAEAHLAGEGARIVETLKKLDDPAVAFDYVLSSLPERTNRTPEVAGYLETARASLAESRPRTAKALTDLLLLRDVLEGAERAKEKLARRLGEEPGDVFFATLLAKATEDRAQAALVRLGTAERHEATGETASLPAAWTLEAALTFLSLGQIPEADRALANLDLLSENELFGLRVLLGEFVGRLPALPDGARRSAAAGDLNDVSLALEEALHVWAKEPTRASTLFEEIPRESALPPQILGDLEALACLSLGEVPREGIETSLDAAATRVLSLGALLSDPLARLSPTLRRDALLAAHDWLTQATEGGEENDEALLDAAVLTFCLSAIDGDGERRRDAEHVLESRLAPGTRAAEAAWEVLEDVPLGPSEARRRALLELCDAMNEGPADDADRPALELLAAYEALLLGEAEKSLELFLKLVESLGDDIAVLEGLRLAASLSERVDLEVKALMSLAQYSLDDRAGAELWERAGDLFRDRLGSKEEAERCYASALGRDAERSSSFERLYRLVRARGDATRLVELIDGRLDLTLGGAATAELLWEKALLCRKTGRRASSLRALLLLLDLSPTHLPALALLGEMHLADERLAEAAAVLAKIAVHPDSPLEERTRAGLFACDLYERLRQPKQAVAVLTELESWGVDEALLRERRARSAAHAGEWDLAYRSFLELSDETDRLELRLSSSRMMLAIQRDHLREFGAAEDAARRVLRDAPTDPDAVDVVLEGNFSPGDRMYLLAAPLAEARKNLEGAPLDPEFIERFAAISEKAESPLDHRIALGILALSGRLREEDGELLRRFTEEKRTPPSLPLSASDLELLLPPSATRAPGQAARAIGTLLGPALAPDLGTLGVSVSMRIDPFAESPLRNLAASYAALFGLGDFELYSGGKDPGLIFPMDRDFPSLVMGRGLPLPLSPIAEARLTVAMFALSQRTQLFLTESQESIEAWLDAGREALGMATSSPPDTERLDVWQRVLTAEAKEELLRLLEEILSAGGTVAHIRLAAQMAAARAAVLVYGDPSILRGLTGLLPEDPEERRVLLADVIGFAISETFVNLRRKTGLECG